MSAENVAIVKSSWAGWRQKLHAQMVRDFSDGVEDRIEAWADSAGGPDLQALEFADGGNVVLVCAVALGARKAYWFNYKMDGPRIVGWDAYEKEAEAREAAGLPV